jgi:exosortase/archaeosortase family protein
MITAAAHGPCAALRGSARRLELALGLGLAGLWAIEAYPAASAALAPLNELTAQLTAAMLAAIGVPVVREAVLLTHDGGFACEITRACTALIPVVLLAAAVLSQPLPWRTRLSGLLVGMLLVIAINQVRLVSLVWLGVQAPALFGAAHVLVWPVLLTLASAGYWWVWLRAASR